MIDELIKDLGGPQVVAEWISDRSPDGKVITGDAVTAWYMDGRKNIPWRWRALVLEMAKTKNVVLTKSQMRELALRKDTPEVDHAAS